MLLSRKPLVTGALLAGALALASAELAVAQPGGNSPARMLEHMTDKLDLSAAQQSQVQDILQRGKADAGDDYRRMAEIRDALRAMRGDFDADEARRLSDELGQLAARSAYEMTATFAEVYEVLTPEQRAQLEEMAASREQRGKKRSWR